MELPDILHPRSVAASRIEEIVALQQAVQLREAQRALQRKTRQTQRSRKEKKQNLLRTIRVFQPRQSRRRARSHRPRPNKTRKRDQKDIEAQDPVDDGHGNRDITQPRSGQDASSKGAQAQTQAQTQMQESFPKAYRLRANTFYAKRFTMETLWQWRLPVCVPGRGKGIHKAIGLYKGGQSLCSDLSFLHFFRIGPVTAQGSADETTSDLVAVFENEGGAIFLSTWLHSELIIAVHPALKLEMIVRNLRTLCERRGLKFQRVAKGRLGVMEIVGKNITETFSRGFGIQAQQMKLGGDSLAVREGRCIPGRFFSVGDPRLHELDRASSSPDKGSLSELFQNNEPISKSEVDQIRRTSRYAKRLKTTSSSPGVKPSSLFLGIVHQCRRTQRCDDPVYQQIFVILPGEWMKAVVHTLHRIGTPFLTLEERRVHRTYMGFRSFPWDFPQSIAHAEVLQMEARKVLEQFNKTPPAKRGTAPLLLQLGWESCIKESKTRLKEEIGKFVQVCDHGTLLRASALSSSRARERRLMRAIAKRLQPQYLAVSELSAAELLYSTKPEVDPQNAKKRDTRTKSWSSRQIHRALEAEIHSGNLVWSPVHATQPKEEEKLRQAVECRLQLLKVQVVVIGKGRAESGSAICMPKASDWEAIHRSRAEDDETLPSVVESVVIGFVTSVLPPRGSGLCPAIGFCNSQHLYSMLLHQHVKSRHWKSRHHARSQVNRGLELQALLLSGEGSTFRRAVVKIADE